jgi:hypothetical protein
VQFHPLPAPPLWYSLLLSKMRSSQITTLILALAISFSCSIVSAASTSLKIAPCEVCTFPDCYHDLWAYGVYLKEVAIDSKEASKVVKKFEVNDDFSVSFSKEHEVLLYTEEHKAKAATMGTITNTYSEDDALVVFDVAWTKKPSVPRGPFGPSSLPLPNNIYYRVKKGETCSFDIAKSDAKIGFPLEKGTVWAQTYHKYDKKAEGKE